MSSEKLLRGLGILMCVVLCAPFIQWWYYLETKDYRHTAAVIQRARQVDGMQACIAAGWPDTTACNIRARVLAQMLDEHVPQAKP